MILILAVELDNLNLIILKNENLCDIDKVELGSAVTFALANLKVKEKVKLKFATDCTTIVLKSTMEIKEKYPLKCCLSITIRDDL